jgi:hypothetical protein
LGIHRYTRVLGLRHPTQSENTCGEIRDDEEVEGEKEKEEEAEIYLFILHSIKNHVI